jgi:hypothetical protein
MHFNATETRIEEVADKGDSKRFFFHCEAAGIHNYSF